METYRIVIIIIWLLSGGMYYSLKVTRFTLNEQIKNGAMLKGKHHEIKVWLIALIQLLVFPIDIALTLTEKKGSKK